MIIEKIEIREFGRLKNATFDFDERVQIIEGENESGKSTLAAFIRYMLYGFPRSVGEVSEKKKRIGWDGGIAAGSMTVRLSDGSRYRIERVTTVTTAGGGARETYREVAQTVDLSTNTPLPNGQNAGELLLGVPEDIYRATAFVGQLDTASVGGREVCEAIENILFSGDESVNLPKALSKLDAVRRSLYHKNGKGGELYDLENEAAELARRLAIAKEKNAEILEKEAEADKLKKQIEADENALTAATIDESNGYNRLLIAAFDHLHEAEAQKAAAERALHSMDGLPIHRLTESDLADLRAGRRTVEEAERVLLAASAKRDGAGESPVDDGEREQIAKMESLGGAPAVRRTATAARNTSVFSLVCAALGLIAAVLGAALPTLRVPPISYLLFGLGGALAVAGAVLFFLMRKKSKTLAAAFGASDLRTLLAKLDELDRAAILLAAHRESKSAAEIEESVAMEAYNRALGLLDTVVRRFGKPLPSEDIYGFLDTLEETARAAMDKKKQYMTVLAAAEARIEEVNLRTAGADEAAVREALPADYSVAVRDINLDNLRVRKSFYEGRVKAVTAQYTALERELHTLRLRAEDPVALEADYALLLRRVSAAKEKYRATVMAYEALDGAGARLREEIAPNLTRFAKRLVEHLTDGKYTELGVDNNLSLTVTTDEGGTVSIDYMSAGTQDLAYLSLRMALIDLLYREKPPVCFDESFSHQDNRRAARMIELVRAMGETGQQCLLFTCHSREGELWQEAYGTPALVRL